MQDTMRAISDPTRRQILALLRKNRLAAGEIAEHFAMSAPAVSKHLNVLKAADLIRDAREGKHIYYELNASVLDEALMWLTNLKEGNI
ncbi:MAG: winged helix-turn-helix transcriptional regulator [Clostridia bacterium]|nr:winged helix-turn-helix transcriptional regulator [Clostridia bacterium]